VLANFKIGELWVGRDDERRAFQRRLAEARSRDIPVVQKTQGAEADWRRAQASVLWPPATEPGGATPNDASLALRLSDGRVHALLTGDIEEHTEDTLAEEHAPLAADFLKAAHHGSRTSSTEDCIAAVAPRMAAVSVGEANRFGHPSESVSSASSNTACDCCAPIARAPLPRTPMEQTSRCTHTSSGNPAP
jgi:competence protein ComEC